MTILVLLLLVRRIHKTFSQFFFFLLYSYYYLVDLYAYQNPGVATSLVDYTSGLDSLLNIDALKSFSGAGNLVVPFVTLIVAMFALL